MDCEPQRLQLTWFVILPTWTLDLSSVAEDFLGGMIQGRSLTRFPVEAAPKLRILCYLSTLSSEQIETWSELFYSYVLTFARITPNASGTKSFPEGRVSTR